MSVSQSGVSLIAAERERQVSEEGWTREHDDGHGDGSLAWAAACYAAPDRVYREERYAAGPLFRDPWPWADSFDKRKSGNVPTNIPTEGEERIRMLARAGALIAAEIDRLQREASASLREPPRDGGEPPSWIERTATGYRMRLDGSLGDGGSV